jgi:diketogulonate reductase-like aldo/keto reductase
MTSATTVTRTVHGLSVPSLFYGTAWKEERTAPLVERALAAGFRGFDTANQRKHYCEAAVGDALAAAVAAGGVTRAQLFLQTKFTYREGQDHRLPFDAAAPLAEQVRQSLASSLQHLHVGYVDSFVLHGPLYRDGWSDADRQVWRAMSELARAGQTRLIGVSNVGPAQLAALLDEAEVKPAFVQNRCYARAGWDREVRALCRAHDVVYQGFSLLTANRRELAQPAVASLAARHGRTVAQVVFRFALQLGMIPLTGTSDPRHMREDLAVFDFALDEDELGLIEQIAEVA